MHPKYKTVFQIDASRATHTHIARRQPIAASSCIHSFIVLTETDGKVWGDGKRKPPWWRRNKRQPSGQDDYMFLSAVHGAIKCMSREWWWSAWKCAKGGIGTEAAQVAGYDCLLSPSFVYLIFKALWQVPDRKRKMKNRKPQLHFLVEFRVHIFAMNICMRQRRCVCSLLLMDRTRKRNQAK